MTELTEDERARNRFSDQHKARRVAKKANKGWRGRRISPGAEESPLGRIEGETLAPAFKLASDLVAVCIRVTPDVDPARFAASIRSLLTGNHKNVQVVLLSDGEDPDWAEEVAEFADDPRVLRVEVPEGEPNAGYATVARLTRAPFIAFQGPHDESLPGRLADQLAAIVTTQADACFTPAREPGTRKLRHAGLEPTAAFGELAPNTGLFRTEAVSLLGGIHPGAGGLRLLTSLVALLGKVATTKVALYVRHDGLLTDEPGEATTALYEEVFAAVGTSVGTAVQAAKASVLRARDRTMSDAPWQPLVNARVPVPAARFIESVLRLEFPEDRVARQDALDFIEDLTARKPGAVLVAAHRAAVVVAAMYAGATGASVLSLEEGAESAGATRKLLDRLGLDGAQVRHAKLREQLVKPVGYVWHDFDPGQAFGETPLDYVFLDSGPGRVRRGALFHLLSVIRDGTRFRLTDGAALAQTLDLWRTHRHVAVTEGEGGRVDVDLVVDPESAATIVVTILTGSRPKFLMRTLKALARYDAQLVEEARVVVLVNGADDLSCKVASGFAWVDTVETTPEILPVPQAASALMELVGADAEFILHLEDDWECKSEGWRQRAVSLLRGDASVGQVLVGTPHEGTPSVNPISGRRISWENERSPRGFRYRVGAAGYTLRPSLIRGPLGLALWPSETEREAMERFHELGCKVARLHDAPFHHIGGDDSLRGKLGR